MSWLDGLVLAVRSIARRPARTALTILAVMLGSGLLVGLLTIAGTADSKVVSQLGKGGPLAAIKVVAAQAAPDQLTSDELRPQAPLQIDGAALKRMRRAPSVRDVVPALSVQVLVVPPPLGLLASDQDDFGVRAPDTFFDTMVGTNLDDRGSLPITVLAGRLPESASSDEVAVTQGYLDHLKIKDPATALGNVVEIAEPRAQLANAGTSTLQGRWLRATIVGVVAQSVADGDLLVPLPAAETARSWTLSGDGSSSQVQTPTSPYSSALVVASDLTTVHTVRAEITTLGYATSAPEHLIASVQKYLHVVDIVLGGIGLIALSIAALGIANALLAAVRERRREIGVLKAIGARDGDVLRWFLLEAGVVGFVGGVLGTALGVAVALTVGLVADHYLIEQGLEGVNLGGVPPSVVLLGVAGSTALALVAGALPSLRAARLPAREAVDAG